MLEYQLMSIYTEIETLEIRLEAIIFPLALGTGLKCILEKL